MSLRKPVVRAGDLAVGHVVPAAPRVERDHGAVVERVDRAEGITTHVSDGGRAAIPNLHLLFTSPSLGSWLEGQVRRYYYYCEGQSRLSERFFSLALPVKTDDVAVNFVTDSPEH